MRTHRASVAGLMAAACVSAVAGCGSLSSRTAALTSRDHAAGRPPGLWAPHFSNSPAQAAAQSAAPAIVTLPEESAEVSGETRVHVALAMAEMLERAGKLNQAQSYYEKALELDPKNVEALLALALIYSHQGRPDAARRIYERAEKQHRKNPAVHNDKGLFLAEQKEFSAAIESLRRAVKLDSSNIKYHNNLAMVLAASGNYGEAWKEFRTAVGAGRAHYNVALMLQRAGRSGEARDHAERALAEMPDLKEANTLLAELTRPSADDSYAAPGRDISPTVEDDRHPSARIVCVTARETQLVSHQEPASSDVRPAQQAGETAEPSSGDAPPSEEPAATTADSTAPRTKRFAKPLLDRIRQR